MKKVEYKYTMAWDKSDTVFSIIASTVAFLLATVTLICVNMITLAM